MTGNPDWHASSITAVLRALETDANGLSGDEAASRLQKFGPNRLRPPTPVSALRVLSDQFKSIVVYLLFAAVLVSAVLGDWAEAAAVALVLLINTALGFTMELRARRTMDALVKMNVVRASVFRDGHLVTVDAAVLVKGDIVELTAGHHVPADSRLIHVTDFRTDEAALTGESELISKAAAVERPVNTALADRINMIYKGTTVAQGVARAVVVATGVETELGRIGGLVAEIAEDRTPLERRLDELGRRLVWLALAIALVVAGLSALQGSPWSLVFQMGIALAVAAVPEALPAVATIALAVGLKRMASRHALVRRLSAVEALGSTTVICTDKTRTLTSGDMTVVRLRISEHDFDIKSSHSPDSNGERRVLHALLETGARASRTQADAVGEVPTSRDPVDAAFLAAATDAGIRVAVSESDQTLPTIPFSSERQLMASFRRDGDRLLADVKGAPRRVLALSERVLTTEGEHALDAPARRGLMTANDDLARDGLRVLALATGPVAGATEADLGSLTFLGFAGLIDPPASGVRETIERLRAADLRTVMLTGDQRLTATTIGRELGVLHSGDQIIDGRELDGLSREALAHKVRHVAAFSRISPEHKLDVIRALQSAGEIVAMIGDGVNDAPALKKADVGVAMGIRGTDVAKEAAAIVLQDDRFETVAAAVEEGRVIYDNIRKFVFYLFSCNLAEVLMLLAAGVAGLPLPLLPLQILWLNIVTDTFPALALAMEPADAGVMQRTPERSEDAILSRGFVSPILFYGVLIAASALGAFLWALQNAPVRATTIAFMTLALAQVFHLATARGVTSLIRPAVANPYALGATGLAIGLQVAAVYVTPLAMALVVSRPELVDWVVIIGFAAIPAVTGHGVRSVQVRRRARSAHTSAAIPK
jgi:P-type Ca2+ transporter type 2C